MVLGPVNIPAPKHPNKLLLKRTLFGLADSTWIGVHYVGYICRLLVFEGFNLILILKALQQYETIGEQDCQSA